MRERKTFPCEFFFIFFFSIQNSTQVFCSLKQLEEFLKTIIEKKKLTKI